jgi:hypothetical protein
MDRPSALAKLNCRLLAVYSFRTTSESRAAFITIAQAFDLAAF